VVIPAVDDMNRDEVITTRLDTDVVRRLREIARDNERTLSAEIRLAVRVYLEWYVAK
jgi:predicted transcriptional regulator